MSDPTSTVGGDGPVGTQPGSPASPPEVSVPEGKAFVDAKEYETLKRNNERVRAYEQFHGEASKRGFRRPEDWSRLDKFDSWLKSAGLTMDQLMQAKREDDADTGSTTGLDPKALEKWAKEQGFVKSTDLEQREVKFNANLEHKKAMEAERELVSKLTSELLGEKPTDWERRTVAAAVREMLEEKRPTYPEGHPLHSESLAAYDEKGLAPIFEEVKKLRLAATGQEMAQAGDAALKGKVSSPAGSQPTKPTTTTKNEGTRPGGLPSVAAIENAHKKIVAKRGGNPVSALGG